MALLTQPVGLIVYVTLSRKRCSCSLARGRRRRRFSAHAGADFQFCLDSGKSAGYRCAMSLAGVVEDLLALQRLAEGELDAARRQILDEVRQHVADRDRGAKVVEAAQVLGVSAPTVRAWMDAGALQAMAGSRPVRVGVMSLAATRSVLDELRRYRDDRHLLAGVLRVLRDRGDLASQDVAEGVDDFSAGRVRRLDRAGLDDLLPPSRTRASTSS